jgi:molybdopterin-binding protein
MLSFMELLKIPEAAALLKVTPQTVKQWIYKGKIRSATTPGGHHRIPQSEITRLSGIQHPASTSSRNRHELQRISGRNKLMGTVIDVKVDGLMGQVTIDVGGQVVTAIITRTSCEELRLKKGMPAYALVKATEVMVGRV